MITKPKIKPKRLSETKKNKKEARVEQSLGIRIVALTMNLLLIIASASYVPTLPIATFMFAATAILGSYLAYAFRNSRPAWVGTIPTVATILLFTNFFFELYTGYANGMHTAVGAFIHMLTGLLALHCFDLRSRTDFSISALIGLGLLTCLAGMARDVIYGFYIFTYTILAGLLLFYDSSSRSHEIGPSRAVPSAIAAAAAKATQKDAQAATQVKPPELVIKRLRIASLSPFIPVFILPFLSYLAFSGMPRIDSVIDIFKDNFVRAQLPISAALSDQLGKGGRSQSIRGGAPETKAQGGASYTVSKSNQSGTASGSSPNKGDSGSGSGSGSGNGNTGNNSNGQKNSGSGGKPGTGGLPSPEAIKALAREKALNEAYQKETVELRGAANQLEEIVLKVSSPQASYIRRYSLNNFDGVQWTRSVPVATTTIRPTPNSRIGLDLTASDAVYVPPGLPTLEVKQDFRVEQDNVFGHILPASWIPQLVKQKGKEDAEIRVDGDGTIKLVSTLQRGSAYSVVSQIPVYDFDQMRHLPLETIEQVTDDRDNEIKLARSCQTPYTAGGDEIEKLANDIAGKEGNWFYRSDKICQYLRKNYKYDPGSFYTEDTPAPAPVQAPVQAPAPAVSSAPEPGAGRKAEVEQPTKSTTEPKPELAAETKESYVGDFLFVKKRGNCRHFATAFVLLCRAQGIPARIVTGFLPGQLNKTTGYWEVRGKHAHVWAEIYLPYWNWVPFDATPNGQLPAHEEGGNALTRFVKSGLANPFGQNYSPSRKPRHQKERTQREGDRSGDKGNDTKNNKLGLFDFGANKGKSQKIKLPLLGNVDQGLMQQFFKYSIIFFALLALAAILFVYLKQRKETERREYLQTHKPSTLIFLEVLSDLKRYELLKGPTETADELSLRLGDRINELAQGGRYIPDELPEMVSNFMEIYSEDRFGGADKLDELTIMSGKIKSLVQSKGRK